MGGTGSASAQEGAAEHDKSLPDSRGGDRIGEIEPGGGCTIVGTRKHKGYACGLDASGLHKRCPSPGANPPPPPCGSWGVAASCIGSGH